jgi:uncharacterized protein YjbI with pentapeptide repeats
MAPIGTKLSLGSAHSTAYDVTMRLPWHKPTDTEAIRPPRAGLKLLSYNEEMLGLILVRHEVWTNTPWHRYGSTGKRADLRGADMRAHNLSGKCLARAQLQGACLRGVDLSGANLRRASLQGADLRRAKLPNAKLAGANLTGADLRGADLTGADLRSISLRSANLQCADLRGAEVCDQSLRETKYWELALYDQCHSNRLDLTEEQRLLALQFAAREKQRFREVDVEGSYLRSAQLAGTILSGVDLAGANLTGVDLQGANLEEADLSGACLRNANLREANLRGADLQHADLTGADVENTVLRDCDLCCAKLTEARFLTDRQLAGAVLTDASLPEETPNFKDRLDKVEELSKNAGKLFISMFAGCLYAWLTIFSTTDAGLLADSVPSKLPIVNIDVSISYFFWWAPVLLATLYLYFHLYLQLMWEELACLPAVFRDGRPVYKMTYPWLPNDLVRFHLARLRHDRSSLAYIQQLLCILFGYGLVPFTLWLFWARSLRRHQMPLTGEQILLLALVLWAAGWFYFRASLTLGGKERLSLFGRWPLASPVTGPQQHWPRALPSVRPLFPALVQNGVAFGAIAGLFSTLSIAAINGRPPPEQISSAVEKPPVSMAASKWQWVTDTLRWIGCSPFMDIRDSEVSSKRSDWTEANYMAVNRARLAHSDLRYAAARAAFLVKADLSNAVLYGSDLRRADLRMATLDGADLRKADLREAKLTGASLNHAWLEDANLSPIDLNLAKRGSGADLASAKLNVARLTGADFRYACLRGADLTECISEGGTNFESADLRGAQLDRATLDTAKFGSADLSRAVLNSAQLPHVQLSFSTLDGADLSSAVLTDAELTDVDLSTHVSLDGANIDRAHLARIRGATVGRLTSGQNWLRAFYDLELLQLLKLDHYVERSGKSSPASPLAVSRVLRGIDLHGFTLRHSDLRRYDFTGADLTDADLTGSDLTGAVLVKSRLSRTVLTEAVLSAADLTDASGLSTSVFFNTHWSNDTKWPRDFRPESDRGSAKEPSIVGPSKGSK